MLDRFLGIKKRFQSNPRYKYFFIEKVLRTIFAHVINIFIFPIRYLLFGDISVNSLVNINTSFRNFKNIYIGNNVTINHGVVLWAGLEKGIHIDQSTQI